MIEVTRDGGTVRIKVSRDARPESFRDYYTPAKVAELQSAFNKVAPSPNWKTAIYSVIEGTVEEIGIVKEAVTFFTGSVASVTRLATLEDGRLRVRVQAVGYYAAIGA